MYSTFYTVKTKTFKTTKNWTYIHHTLSWHTDTHTPEHFSCNYIWKVTYNNIHEKISRLWLLRGMQFLGNTVQKKGNLVQKRVTSVTFWLANKQRNSLRANQMRHLNGTKFGSAPDQFRAKTAMVGICKTHFLWRPKQL